MPDIPDISKIKLVDGTIVNIKDATGRTNMNTLIGSHALKALGSAAWLGVDASLASDGAGVVVGSVIKNYVDSAVGKVHNFDVVIDTKGDDGKPSTEASADTMYKIYLVPDDDAEAGTYVEFITIRSGSEGAYTYDWEKIGSTKTDLSDYVPNTRKVAEIPLNADISVSALQSALGLKNLAYASTATGSSSISTIDSITMKQLTVSGNASVTTADASATLTKADYTPAGTVSGNVTAQGTVSVTLADAASATEASLTYSSYTPAGTIAATSEGTANALTQATFGQVSAETTGAVQIGGSVAAPTVTLTPSTTAALSGASLSYTAPSFTEGAFTAATWSGSSYTAPTWTGSVYSAPTLGSASTSSFATDGILATVNTSASSGDDDYELLTFTSASSGNAVTAQGTFNAGSVNFGTFAAGSLAFGTFDGGSKAADSFDAGSATLSTSSADVLNASTTASATAPAFTGSYYANSTLSATVLKEVTFSGTAADIKVSKVEYVKPVVSSATFTGSSADISASFSGSTAASVLVTGVSYKEAQASASFSVDVTPEVSAYTSTAKTISVTVSAD